MIIKENLTKVNFTKGKNKKNKYIVIHYTANDGDTDEGNANYFKNIDRNASANYFVDEDSCTRVVKDTDIAHHCGDTQKYTNGGAQLKGVVKNSNSIGIELCSDKVNGEYVITEKTVENAVELVRMLMEKYSIPVENVVRHYDVTGKTCPQPFVKDVNKWLDFKKRLTKEVEEVEKIYNKLEEFNEGYREALKWCMENGILFGNENGLGLTKSEAKGLVFLYRAMKSCSKNG